MMAEKNVSAGVQSVERAFTLLETLGELGGQAGVSELAEKLDLALPTIHRLLQTLVTLGYVRRLQSRRYALGPGLIRLGDRAEQLLVVWARPALQLLEEQTHETANLAILDGDRVAYVAQIPSRHQMRMFTEVGRRVHLHSTGVGKAILSQLPDHEVSALVRRSGMPGYTATTITSEVALLADLHEIRERGYAIDEGEQENGVRCFAMAVPGAFTPTAVSISGPDTRVTLELADSIAEALRRAADDLRAALQARTDPAAS